MSKHPPEELAGLLPPLLWQLSQCGEVRHYRKGVVLIQEGHRGEGLFVIFSGRLRWFSANNAGKELTYGEHGPGDYVGELCLDGHPHPYSVVTKESCHCAVVSRQSLLHHLAARPELYAMMLEKSLARIRTLTVLSHQLGLDDVYTRLRTVLEAPVSSGRGGLSHGLASHAWVRLTQKDMACRIGCSREMVSRLLKDLELGGFVRRHPAGVEVLRRLPPRW